MFHFTTITSASLEGIIKTNNTPSNISFTLGPKPHQINDTTDNLGHFNLEGIGQGKHSIVVYSSYGPRISHFFVPAGKEILVVSFDARNMSAFTLPSPTKEQFVQGQNKINAAAVVNSQVSNNMSKTYSSVAPTNTISNTIGVGNHTSIKQQGIISDISLFQESTKSSNQQNPFSTRIWINTLDSILSDIENVTYYLHPTFNPPVVTSFTKENNFDISFSNWGTFDLYATVFFKDGSIAKLELPSEKWKGI